MYTLYALYAHTSDTEGAGQGVGDVCTHTSKNTSKYTDFSYSNSYSKYTAMLSSRVLYLHARLRTASIRCKLTPRGLIKAHSMHLLAIGGPMVLGKQVPDHIATANADWGSIRRTGQQWHVKLFKSSASTRIAGLPLPIV